MGDWVTYWATTAQVLPLVGLAVVLEVRIITSRWNAWPEWLRWIQGSLWFLLLLAVAVLTPMALRATSPESSPPIWLDNVSETTISAGLGIAVLSPAVDVAVRAFAGPLAGLFTIHPRLRLAVWWDGRRLRKLRRRYGQEENRLESLADQQTEAFNRIEVLLAGLYETRQTLEAVLGDTSVEESVKTNATKDLQKVDKVMESIIEEGQKLKALIKERPHADHKGIEELEAMLEGRKDTVQKAIKSHREAVKAILSSIEDHT